MDDPHEKKPSPVPKEYFSPESSPPHPLDSTGESITGFVGGIGIGIGITIAYIGIAVKINDHLTIRAIVISVMIKAAFGIILLRRKEWRPVGLGILTSIALGGLIVGTGAWYLATCKPL